MKKTFTIVIFLSFVFVVRAQDVPEGTVMIGGTLSYSHQNKKQDNNQDVISNSIILNPSIGKFYRRNRMVGINLYYGHSKSSDSQGYQDVYGGGIFLRQYLPLGRSFYIFAEEGASFKYQHLRPGSDGTYYATDQKTTIASVYFYPGIAYSVTPRFQLELALTSLASLSYVNDDMIVWQNSSPLPRVKTSSISFQTGSPTTSLGSLSFGVKWLLAKNSHRS